MKFRTSCQSALCQSLVAMLRKGFVLEQAECDLSFDGSPPPMAGQWFWAVHGGDLRMEATDDFTSMPTVNVTLSHRTGDMPHDRLGEVVYGDQGLMSRLEHFCAWIAQRQYDWQNAANELLAEGSETPVNGLIEPGFKLVIQNVRSVNAEHWKSYGGRTEKLLTPQAHAGLVGTVRITDFKRVQYLETCSDG